MQRSSWMSGISVLCLIASAHLADRCFAGEPPVIHVSAAGSQEADGSPKRPFATLEAAAGGGVEPGTAILIDGAAGPQRGKVSLNELRGTPDRRLRRRPELGRRQRRAGRRTESRRRPPAGTGGR